MTDHDCESCRAIRELRQLRKGNGGLLVAVVLTAAALDALVAVLR